MNKIKRIIRPMLCMVVLLVAMTTGVMGCYQKDPDPIEDPSGTSEVEATPIPAVNRQAELADAKSKPTTPWRDCVSPARRWTTL